MMPKMIWSVASSAWLSVIMWPMPLRGADQLGDDDVGPGPAEHHAQRLGDLGRRAGDQHAADQAAVARAQRVGRLDQVAPRVAHGHRDHQHQLEEAADEDHRQLLRLADAGPQDQQRDEGAGRQVAREADEGLEEGLDRLVRAHRTPSGSASTAAMTKPPSTRHTVMPMSCAKPISVSSVQPLRTIVQRVGQEGLADEAAERRRRPDGDEQHEEARRRARCACPARPGSSGFMRSAHAASLDEARVGQLRQVGHLLDDAGLQQQIGRLLAELRRARRRRTSGSPRGPASAGRPGSSRTPRRSA